MVAIEIDEDGKVWAGMQATPPIHPAALMFPTADKAGISALVKDIMRNGLHDAIVLTPNGNLLEGRGRWQACRALELTPRTRIERGDPWLYVIHRNKAYLDTLEPVHRAIVVGAIPSWGTRGRPRNAHRYDDPPTLDAIADAIGAHRQAVSRAQRIVAGGTVSLRNLVAAGKCPVYTAVRVLNLTHEQQEQYVNRVLNGAPAAQIAPDTSRPEAERRARSRAKTKEYVPIRGRSRYLRTLSIRQLIDSMHAAGMVVDAAGGLDPSITPEDAAKLAKELAATHSAYSRVSALLRARKEEAE